MAPFTEIFAKSASEASIFATAAQPPFESISERRNSLNHTSPLKVWFGSTPGFFTPTTHVLIAPSDGLPLMENLYFFSPGRDEFKSNSWIRFKSSSKKVAPLIFLLAIDLAFNFVKISIGISISLSSTCHTSSADRLLEIPLEYAVGFSGISIW